MDKHWLRDLFLFECSSLIRLLRPREIVVLVVTCVRAQQVCERSSCFILFRTFNFEIPITVSETSGTSFMQMVYAHGTYIRTSIMRGYSITIISGILYYILILMISAVRFTFGFVGLVTAVSTLFSMRTLRKSH
jgi:hypothetical protein